MKYKVLSISYGYWIRYRKGAIGGLKGRSMTAQGNALGLAGPNEAKP